MTQAAVHDRVIGVACPQCRRQVRVPAARIADAPRCPACRVALIPGVPVDLDERSFDLYIGRSDIPVLVDFWAPWCGPCRSFAPVLAGAAASFAPALLVAKVNTEAAQPLAARHAIRSIPTIALYRGGREVARASGALPAAALREWLAAQGITP